VGSDDNVASEENFKRLSDAYVVKARANGASETSL
jgi:hypothetical protein